MHRRTRLAGSVALAVILAGGWLVWAQEKKGAEPQPQVQEQERSIKEAEVPAPALATLKKLAGSAPLTGFAEEIEHGQKHYEGSWKGPDGNVDALVTATGDIVEIEETMPGEKVPAGVRAAAEKEAGAGAKVSFERKTVHFYEAKFKKDGRVHEVLYSADARRQPEEPDQDEDETGEEMEK